MPLQIVHVTPHESGFVPATGDVAMNPVGLGDFRITPHAIREIRRRGMTVRMVESVVVSPEQRFPVRAGRDVFQSRIPVEGGVRLVRVFVDTDATPPVVVTAYKTSRIAKYGRPST